MRVIIFILSIFCFASCDPGVQYYQRLENQSNYTINVSWITDSATTESIILLPDAEATVFDYSKIWRASEFSNCDLLIDSLSIVPTDTNLTFTDKLKYVFSILEKRTMYSRGECRAIITDAMFQ